MKKTLTILATVFVLFNLSAQRAVSFDILDENGAVITGTTLNVPVVANMGYKHELKIKNLTANVITYKVERIYLTTPYCAGSSIYYCAAGLCFPPDSAIVHSTLTSTIQANETLPNAPFTYGIEAHYDVGPTCCTEDVMYKVINVNNSSDTASIIFHYQCVSGVQETSTAFSFYTFPNPANGLLHINYQLNNSTNNEVVVHDMLGKEIKKITLKGNKGIETIDISEFVSGIYFCTLQSNNQMVETKKIIIGIPK